MLNKEAQMTSQEIIDDATTVTTLGEGDNRGPDADQPVVKSSLRHRLKAWYIFPFVAVVAILSALLARASSFPDTLRINVGTWAAEAWDWFATNGEWLYGPISDRLEDTFEGLFKSLSLIAPPVIVAAIVCAIFVFRGWRLALLAVASFAWILLTELWQPTLETVAFMVVAVALSAIVGLALGLIGSGNAKLEAGVRLLVDAMQAYPAFAYMVPAIVLLGVGNTAALAVTVVWAAPPLARMTSLGLRGVSPEVIEAAVSTGANRRQLLFGVKLPMASHSIRAGFNQTIMYAIAMATMAAMIGAAGLGAPVWSGLSRLDFGDALEAGIALVLIAILLDRVSASRPDERRSVKGTPRTVGKVQIPSRRTISAIVVFIGVFIGTLLFRGPWQDFDDPPWGKVVSLSNPIDATIGWLNTTWGPAFDGFRDTVQTFGLNPLGSFFASIPWYITLVCVVAVSAAVSGWVAGLFSGVGVLAIGAMGMWPSTVETLAVVTTAMILVVIVAFPLGILMSASDRAASVMQPILDVMQTLPIFLFVIPAVVLLGTGEVAGTLATFFAATPPMIRYTNAALRGVDPEVVEASVTFGATRSQVLRQVRIPLGLPTLMVGLNQAVLIALSMAVVSAFIGSPGLGQDILYSLQRLDLAIGVEAGLAMFLLAVIIDRIFQGTARMLSTATHTPAAREEATA